MTPDYKTKYEVVCKNCGKSWALHYGENCPCGDTTYCPVGVELTDLCSKCNKPLSEHFEHMFCKSGNVFSPATAYLPDNLFEI